MTDSGSNQPSDRRRADPLQVAAETLAQEEAETEGQTSDAERPHVGRLLARDTSASGDRAAERDGRRPTTPTRVVAAARTPRRPVRPRPRSAARSARPLVPSPRRRSMRATGTSPTTHQERDPRRPGVRDEGTGHPGARPQGSGGRSRAPAQGTRDSRRRASASSDLRSPTRPDQPSGPTPEQRAALRGSGQTAADFAAEGEAGSEPRRSRGREGTGACQGRAGRREGPRAGQGTRAGQANPSLPSREKAPEPEKEPEPAPRRHQSPRRSRSRSPSRPRSRSRSRPRYESSSAAGELRREARSGRAPPRSSASPRPVPRPTG